MKFDLIYEQTMHRLLFEQEGITAIYPGGFKPPHKGHFELAKAYASDPAIKEVKIMLGPKPRLSEDGTVTITEEMSKKVWEEYYIPNLPGNVIVESAPDPVPVRAAYIYVDLHTTAGDIVTLMSSVKDAKDAKRSNEFAEKHKEGTGMYHKPDVDVVYYPKNTVEYYEDRTDNLNGESISASTMRNDIARNDLDNFKTNLPDEVQERAEELLNIFSNP